MDEAFNRRCFHELRCVDDDGLTVFGGLACWDDVSGFAALMVRDERVVNASIVCSENARTSSRRRRLVDMVLCGCFLPLLMTAGCQGARAGICGGWGEVVGLSIY